MTVTWGDGRPTNYCCLAFWAVRRAVAMFQMPPSFPTSVGAYIMLMRPRENLALPDCTGYWITPGICVRMPGMLHSRKNQHSQPPAQ